MQIPEYKRWSFGGGALALLGLLGSAVATRYNSSMTELHPGIFVGLVVFLAAMPMIGIGGLLEAATTGRAQVKLGYVTAFTSLAVGLLILVFALTLKSTHLGQYLGLGFAAMILVSGSVNLLCARIAQELRRMRGEAPVQSAAAGAAG